MLRALLVVLAFVLIPALASAADLTVIGLNGKALVLSAKDLADLPRSEVKTPGPKAIAYDGPTLAGVLRLAGAPSGPMLHGAAMRDYVVVAGKDGFAAVLSLAETNAELHQGAVILADHEDGAPLPPREGPLRLVIAGDLKPYRSVRNVERITLEMAK
ncbi:MAG: molybdopterin-dependent oxidoreductase [Caulobacteraceae bacterium]